MATDNDSVTDSVSFLDSLTIENSVVLPQISFNQFDQMVDDSGLDAVAQALALDTDIRLYVVAHLRNDDSLEQSLQKSQARANLVRSRLLTLGVAPDRLIARGVGPLAPVCSTTNCAQRIEFVLQ